MSDQPALSSTGLAPNVAGALAYVLGPLSGIFFLVVEKENRFVRFHAAQSVVVGIALVLLSVALSIVGGVLAVVPVLGWLIALLLSMVVGFGSFVLWLVLMYRAFSGDEWQLPLVGEYSQKLLSSPAVQ